MQQELTFCVPTHGAAPEKANEIATTDLALKALGVEPVSYTHLDVYKRQTMGLSKRKDGVLYEHFAND